MNDELSEDGKDLKNVLVMVFYLEEESKAHNQVGRWQKVFLSWREIHQMLGPLSDVIIALTLLIFGSGALQNVHTLYFSVSYL